MRELRTLWPTFKADAPGHVHLTRIESAITPGLPDVHVVVEGAPTVETWVELKTARNLKVPYRTATPIRQEQVNWHRRRARWGLTSFILIGHSGGWRSLFPGHMAQSLRDDGIDPDLGLLRWQGGATPWPEVVEILRGKVPAPTHYEI